MSHQSSKSIDRDFPHPVWFLVGKESYLKNDRALLIEFTSAKEINELTKLKQSAKLGIKEYIGVQLGRFVGFLFLDWEVK